MSELGSPAEISQKGLQVERIQNTTPAGTVVECQTSLNGRNDGLSASLSAGFDRPMVAAPSIWNFKGTAYRETAMAVHNVMGGIITSRDSTRFATYGVVPVDGDENEGEQETEPFMSLVIASTVKDANPHDVQRAAKELVTQTNDRLKDLQSPIQILVPAVH